MKQPRDASRSENSRRPRPRARTALLAALVASLAGLPAALGVEGANAGPPAVATAAPAFKVSATKVADPRYGDPLLLNVRAFGGTGDPVNATVSMNGIDLETKELPAQFQIPTTGLQIGTSYRVDVAAGDGTVGGTTYERFVPQLITGTVRVPATTVPYSAFLPVEFAADAPTAVKPTPGSPVRMHTSAQRNVGTGKLDAQGRASVEVAYQYLQPGTHFVEVEYLGDFSYAATGPGTGSFVGELVVERIPTRVEATYSTTVLTKGEPLTMSVVTRINSSFALREWPHGVIRVEARRVGGGDTVVLEPGRIYQGGNQALPLDLSQFAATHTGSWEIRVQNTGDATTAESAVSSTTIQIKEPGTVAIPTTTTLELDPGPVVVGGEVTATASVAGVGGPAPTSGQVAFAVDGTEVGRGTLGVDGTASLAFAPPVVGQFSVTARYLGDATHDGSMSIGHDLFVERAPSKISLAPASVPADSEVFVDVTAIGSKVRPTGSVALREGTTLLGTIPLASGRGRLPASMLSVGTHDLVLQYAGDQSVQGSGAEVTLTVTEPPKAVDSTRATSTIRAGFKSRARHRVKARISVSSATPATGIVEIRAGRRVVARGVLSAGTTSITLMTKRLTPGKRKLTVRYLGSSSVAESSRTYRVRVR